MAGKIKGSELFVVFLARLLSRMNLFVLAATVLALWLVVYAIAHGLRTR